LLLWLVLKMVAWHMSDARDATATRRYRRR